MKHFLFLCAHRDDADTTVPTDGPICSRCCEKPFVWETIPCLPAMAHYMASSSWIPPLCETGTTIVRTADSLGVNMATGLMAEVRAGDRCRTKGTAAEPVELETKPTDSVLRERGSQHWLKC